MINDYEQMRRKLEDPETTVFDIEKITDEVRQILAANGFQGAVALLNHLYRNQITRTVKREA